YGVLWAMKALMFVSSGTPSLAGNHVIVAGVGKVGTHLVARLVDEGARVTVADVDPSAVERVRSRWAVSVVPVAEAHRTPCDIYAPCALGAAHATATIPELPAGGS